MKLIARAMGAKFSDDNQAKPQPEDTGELSAEEPQIAKFRAFKKTFQGNYNC